MAATSQRSDRSRSQRRERRRQLALLGARVELQVDEGKQAGRGALHAVQGGVGLEALQMVSRRPQAFPGGWLGERTLADEGACHEIRRQCLPGRRRVRSDGAELSLRLLEVAGIEVGRGYLVGAVRSRRRQRRVGERRRDRSRAVAVVEDLVLRLHPRAHEGRIRAEEGDPLPHRLRGVEKGVIEAVRKVERVFLGLGRLHGLGAEGRDVVGGRDAAHLRACSFPHVDGLLAGRGHCDRCRMPVLRQRLATRGVQTQALQVAVRDVEVRRLVAGIDDAEVARQIALERLARPVEIPETRVRPCAAARQRTRRTGDGDEQREQADAESSPHRASAASARR
jgi:hypothetical protein